MSENSKDTYLVCIGKDDGLDYKHLDLESAFKTAKHCCETEKTEAFVVKIIGGFKPVAMSERFDCE